MLKKACHDVSAEPETVDFGLSVESHKYKLGIENSSLTSSPLDVIRSSSNLEHICCSTNIEPYIIGVKAIGNWHDSVIPVQLPESFRAFFSYSVLMSLESLHNSPYCHWNPFEITNLKKNQNNNNNKNKATLIICCHVCRNRKLSNSICEKKNYFVDFHSHFWHGK